MYRKLIVKRLGAMVWVYTTVWFLMHRVYYMLVIQWHLILFSRFYTAARALDVLNFTPVNSKTIRIMYSERDPSSRKNVAANVFIKVLI